MKKRLVTIFATAFLASSLNANELDFKKGFDMAVKAIELELINGSNTNRAVNFNYPKMLYLDTKKLSSNEILLMQYIAFSNGFLDTVYVGEKMYFGSYLREADRDTAKQTLTTLLNYTIKEETNNMKLKYATPILNRNFYISKRNIVESSIKRAEYSDWSYADTGAETKNKAPNNLIAKEKNFFIPKKHTTTSYTAKSTDIKNGAFINSKDMRELGTISSNKYKYGRTITDENGLRYVKIYNQNIYLKESEIDFLER